MPGTQGHSRPQNDGHRKRSCLPVGLPGRLKRGMRFLGSYMILLFLKLCVSYISLPTPSLIFEEKSEENER